MSLRTNQTNQNTKSREQFIFNNMNGQMSNMGVYQPNAAIYVPNQISAPIYVPNQNNTYSNNQDRNLNFDKEPCHEGLCNKCKIEKILEDGKKLFAQNDKLFAQTEKLFARTDKRMRLDPGLMTRIESLKKNKEFFAKRAELLPKTSQD
jgi:hypothetical protein